MSIDLRYPGPGLQEEAWVALVAWVIWLRQTYRSIDTALTDCWPRHPDIVLDVLALRDWRNAIYNQAPEEKGRERRPRGELATLWREHLDTAGNRWRDLMTGCRSNTCILEPLPLEKWLKSAERTMGIAGEVDGARLQRLIAPRPVTAKPDSESEPQLEVVADG
jgi:hypothetical protein